MRLYYRHRRPTWFGHVTSQFFCWWARIGSPPRLLVALEVVDRISGKKRCDAVMTPTVRGQRYVVSMFGTLSDWVQNLEACHGDAAIYHGRREHVRLILIPPQERAPVIKEFARIASSGRRHLPLATDVRSRTTRPSLRFIPSTESTASTLKRGELTGWRGTGHDNRLLRSVTCAIAAHDVVDV